MFRRWIALAFAAALVVPLAACTSGPDPQSAAEGLAAALQSGQMEQTSWVAGSPKSDDLEQLREQIFAGMGTSAARVEVTAVERTMDTAAVRLHWTWDLGASQTDWEYTTSATMTLSSGKWCATWSAALLGPDLQSGETISTVRTAASRADIIGEDEGVLATSVPVLRIGVEKKGQDRQTLDAAARQLAQLLSVDPVSYAGRVVAAPDLTFVEAAVVPADAPTAAFMAIPGVVARPAELPQGATPNFAQPVLGAAGIAVVDAGEGVVVVGDVTGRSGLQQRYDGELRGEPGWDVVATASDSGSRSLFHSDPVTSSPLQTTLNVNLQQAAERMLEVQPSASAVVSLDVTTGAIRVLASGPGGGGLSTATIGRYAPGAAFGPVAALALLRSGTTAETTMSCPPAAVVSGEEFSTSAAYPQDALGQISFSTAVANSCTTALALASTEVSSNDLLDAAQSLGLVAELDPGTPAFLGALPDDASAALHAADMTGQGQVLVSPLGIAAAAASIGAGKTVEPYLVEEQQAQKTQTETQTVSELGKSHVTALRNMMRAAVGTAAAGALQTVDDGALLASVGTADYIRADGSTGQHAWAVVISGDLATVVFIDDSAAGVTAATSIAAAFVEASRTA